MSEVRTLLTGFLVAWAIAVGVLAGAVLALRRLGRGGSIRRATMRGCAVTAGLIAASAVVALVDFGAFVTGFHGVFFEGSGWRFGERDTLRQLYPDAFWAAALCVMSVLITLQAGAVAVLWRLLAARHRSGTRRNRN